MISVQVLREAAPEAYNRMLEANQKRFRRNGASLWTSHRTRPGSGQRGGRAGYRCSPPDRTHRLHLIHDPGTGHGGGSADTPSASIPSTMSCIRPDRHRGQINRRAPPLINQFCRPRCRATSQSRIETAIKPISAPSNRVSLPVPAHPAEQNRSQPVDGRRDRRYTLQIKARCRRHQRTPRSPVPTARLHSIASTRHPPGNLVEFLLMRPSFTCHSTASARSPPRRLGAHLSPVGGRLPGPGLRV